MKATAQQAERLHRFAHDLRNRLIGLRQVLEQLHQPSATVEQNEFATFGEQQYFKALREVEDLLDDLHVERGTPRPAMDTLILATLIREVVAQLTFRFQRKAQPVELDLDDQLQVMADPRMLGDLLEALLSNASKFSRNNQPIRLRCHRDGDIAVVSVSDHGTGLSSEDLQQVFTRFAWLANRPTGNETQGRSTLARARDWAHAQCGTLVAESDGVGLGCTFTLRLPAVE